MISFLKASLLSLIFLAIGVFSISAQDSSNAQIESVNSIDNILFTLYDVISGEKGEARDWNVMKYLFHPDAKLIPTGKNKEGLFKARYLTVDDYINSSGKWLVENGFFEN